MSRGRRGDSGKQSGESCGGEIDRADLGRSLDSGKRSCRDLFGDEDGWSVNDRETCDDPLVFIFRAEHDDDGLGFEGRIDLDEPSEWVRSAETGH